MISGGSTSGDSNRTRKMYNRHLESYALRTSQSVEDNLVRSFGPADLEGIITPHEDALMIRVTITNYNVARVFVDSGSFVNILFKEALD